MTSNEQTGRQWSTGGPLEQVSKIGKRIRIQGYKTRRYTQTQQTTTKLIQQNAYNKRHDQSTMSQTLAENTKTKIRKELIQRIVISTSSGKRRKDTNRRTECRFYEHMAGH